MSLVEKFKEAVPNSSTGYAGLAPDASGVPYWVNETVKKEVALREQVPSISGTMLKESGRVAAGSFSGTPKKYSVTFSSPFPDATYAIQITGADQRSFTVESITASGFTINTHSGTSLTGDTHWTAMTAGRISI